MSIVIVDDEPELRELVTSVLEEEGYEVLAFGHPASVTQLGHTDERPQLFLIDIMLPEMDGITLADQLNQYGFEATPKIAMSASRRMTDLARQSNLFAATIDKPFEIDDFLGRVERCTTA